MTLVTTEPGNFNFAQILEIIPNAREVMLATYNLGNPVFNRVIDAIKLMQAGANVTVVCAVPGRVQASEGSGQPCHDIEALVSQLNPVNFRCSVDTWFCFRNHAKIIVADNRAYFGSANLSNGTRNNYEVGCITDDADTIEDLRGFFVVLKNDAVPRSTVQGSRSLRTLMTFCSSIPTFLDVLNQESCRWSLGYGDVEEFQPLPGRLNIPFVARQQITSAIGAIEELELADINSRSHLESIRISLEELSSQMFAFDEGTAIPPELNETHLRGQFSDTFGNVSNDGAMDDTVEAAANNATDETMEDRRQSREEAANQRYAAILRSFAALQESIPALLRRATVHPALRNTVQRWP